MSTETAPPVGRKRLPILPLRDVVVYPHMVIPLFVGREKSVVALDRAMAAQPYAAMGWHVIDTSDLDTEETVDAILDRVAEAR